MFSFILTHTFKQRVFPIFHYALKPNGVLVLSESESVGKFHYLFDPIFPKGLIYRKKQAQPQGLFGEGAFVPFSAEKKRLNQLKK